MHFLSHTSEIFSDQFIFHQHEGGKFHAHHRHGFMETFRMIFDRNNEQNEPQNTENLLEQAGQSKFHLPAMLHDDFGEIGPGMLSYSLYIMSIFSIYLDVLTPPPNM